MTQPTPIPPRTLEESQDDLGIVDALALLSFLLHETLSKHVAAHDLSMIQTRLLGVLRDREPTMQELARLLDLDKSSVTGLVNRAEKRQLVQRAPSSDDRRAVHVRLTPSGRRIVTQAVSAFQKDVASFTDCLSEAEQEQLSTLASRIVNAYAAARGPRVP